MTTRPYYGTNVDVVDETNPSGLAWAKGTRPPTPDTRHPTPVNLPRLGASSDAALVERIVRGDRAAVAEVYDRHAGPAFSLAARLVGAAAAEDIVHDAFVALIDKPDLFDPARGSFRGWFMTVVHHRSLNYLRAVRHSADDAALAELPDRDPEPPDALIQRLQDASVRDALGKLNVDQREVLVLAYYGGLSQSALAARLSVPLGTVKARMRRGLIALRGLLGGEAGEPNEPGKEEAT